MTSVSSDCELVKAYVSEGSEAAFRALVGRHLDLVYATALRQVGDPETAREVAQNVFVTLARKSPRLGGLETLAGWLHRTAVLEAKARIRAELRRKRRHEAAAELAAMQQQGAPALDALVPLLDEALLHLREHDRLALVLRFLEERSLRDVGAELGVDEDAARKRVSRALERVTAFFRARGFSVPAGAGSAAVLASGVQAAPAGLAVSTANAGLAAGSAATGFHTLLFHVMSLTKTQTAVVCAMVVAAPIAWQWRAEARLNRELTGMDAQVGETSRRGDDLEDEARRVRESVLRAQTDTVNLEARLAALQAQRDGRAPRAVYRWDDDSSVVRVPKQFLDRVPVGAVAGRSGRLTAQIKELLQLTETEAAGAQGAVDRLVAGYYAAEKEKMRVVPPTDKDLQGRKPDRTRVFELPNVNEDLKELQQVFFADLDAAIGAERRALFRQAMESWMPGPDYAGISSGMVIFNFDRRERFYQPEPGDNHLSWSVSSANGTSSMNVPIQLDEIPEIFRPYLQDWIALARSRPSAGTNASQGGGGGGEGRQ